MISKAFILLASSALLAGAHSVGDSPYAAVNQVFVPSEDSPFALNNGMANMKNGLGPSQHHHHPSNGPSKHWPHPSATWGGSGGHEDEGNIPTLSLSRGDSTPTLALTRGESQTPTLALTRSNGPTDKPWHKPGPSQWHHKPGPSQYHQSNDGNGVKHPYLGTEGDHSKVHKGSNAQPYVPYVQRPGSHGGAANDGNTSHDNGSGANNGGGSSGNGDMTNGNNGNGGKDHPGNWGPSASARARMAEKTKQDGLYALYGQAAANACGFDAQMPGAEITACPLESGSGWDCLNLASTLESCGGCLSIGEGQDCTLIKGADSVGCVHGKCVIGTCEEGFYLDADQGACVAN